MKTSSNNDLNPEDANNNPLSVIITDLENQENNLKTKFNAGILNSTGNFIMETLFYVITLGSVLMIIFMDSMAPFEVISEIMGKADIAEKIGIAKLQDLKFGIYILLALLGLISFYLARSLSWNRHKNNTLHQSSKFLKSIKEDIQKIN